GEKDHWSERVSPSAIRPFQFRATPAQNKNSEHSERGTKGETKLHVVHHRLKRRGQKHDVDDDKLGQDRVGRDSARGSPRQPPQYAEIFAHHRRYAWTDPHHRADG